MTTPAYIAEHTAVLMLDPYNDFMTVGGKLFEAIKETADASDMFNNLRKLMPAVRSAGFQVFIVPHHRYRADDYVRWSQLNETQKISKDAKMFAVDSWGGAWNEEFGPQEDDVIVQEHWGSSGFANTNLDMQLKQHRIQKIIVVGMIANACVEATGRYGAELGYHVTLVTDATAAFSKEGMIAAATNAPTYAHSILTTAQLLDLLPLAAAKA